MRAPAAALIVAGVAAVVLSQLDWVAGDLVLFGASDELAGPLGFGVEWLERLPNIVGGLGAGAALCGAIALRWPLREVAVIVAIALALGTAFLIAWLVDPPGRRARGRERRAVQLPLAGLRERGGAGGRGRVRRLAGEARVRRAA